MSGFIFTVKIFVKGSFDIFVTLFQVSTLTRNNGATD